jgi:hypothetical protein
MAVQLPPEAALVAAGETTAGDERDEFDDDETGF